MNFDHDQIQEITDEELATTEGGMTLWLAMGIAALAWEIGTGLVEGWNAGVDNRP